MKRKKDSGETRHTHMVLTEIEKLDGRYPKLAFHVKAWLDQGISSPDIVGLLFNTYHIPVSENMVENYRTRRWVPEKELVALKMAVTKAAIEAFGGDVGFDAVVLAKLWELMDKMTIPQLIATRTLFVRIRAQNLKEQEFLYKTGQLKPGQTGEQVDPETQQRNVLRRIKEIFGLATDEDEEEEAPALPAAAPTSEAAAAAPALPAAPTVAGTESG